jgi:hypothetical protein
MLVGPVGLQKGIALLKRAVPFRPTLLVHADMLRNVDIASSSGKCLEAQR